MIIKGLKTKNNIFLAPMAGVTDATFRSICADFGAGLVYSEMVSAMGMAYRNKNTGRLLEGSSGAPCGVQLFGNDPRVMAAQAEALQTSGFALIDINMGCPARKITGNCEGSALMLRPELASAIIKATAEASKLPVTVKIRAGYDDAHKNAVEIAIRAEQAGAAAVTVHGRTREQGYSGKADREIIRQVVRAVSIPVIGNGDITDGDSARAMLDTGCAAIMIGRAAHGRPWIFKEIDCALRGEPCPEITPAERAEVIMRHAEGIANAEGEQSAARKMRTHLCAYAHGMHGAAALRAEIAGVSSLQDIAALLPRLQAGV